MEYFDHLYGKWTPPQFLQRLIQTREMARVRKISQSVTPNNLNPRGPIPNRFQHGMGVAFLGLRVLESNPELADYGILLPVACLYHDAGNSALSHLAEPFLRETTGQDGETFLATILDGSESEKIFRELGISVEDILDLVTGNKKKNPVAEVLHGSMDVDNLDNVLRYSRAACLGREYDAIKIASSFRFGENWWHLLGQCHGETCKWQEARAAVYNYIYGEPHLNMGMMIHRALQIAFCENEIDKGFFTLDDSGAIDFLSNKCNPQTKYLIDRAERWQWYQRIVNFKLKEPNERVKSLASSWKGRAALADSIAREFNIPSHMVCAYAGRGKDKRRIAIPFLKPDDGTFFHDTSDDRPEYRIGVYVPPELDARIKRGIIEFVASEIA